MELSKEALAQLAEWSHIGIECLREDWECVEEEVRTEVQEFIKEYFKPYSKKYIFDTPPWD